jgi:putative oxidoreductase
MGSNNSRLDTGLLLLRVGIGGTLAAHGAQKLFGWFGGHGPKGTGQFFESIGFNPGHPSAVAAGVGEMAGGALLALGLATPAAGAAAASTMAGAAAIHKPQGFFNTEGGLEYPAMLGLASGALGVAGPGRYSLDHLTGNVLNKPWMMTLAMLGGAAAITAVLLSRQLPEPAPADTAAGGAEPADSGEETEQDEAQLTAHPS